MSLVTKQLFESLARADCFVYRGKRVPNNRILVYCMGHFIVWVCFSFAENEEWEEKNETRSELKCYSLVFFKVPNVNE